MNHKWKILLNDNPIFLETWLSVLTHFSKAFGVHIWPVAAQITLSCNKWKSVTIFIFLISKIAYNSDRSADTSGIVLQNLRQEAFLSSFSLSWGQTFLKVTALFLMYPKLLLPRRQFFIIQHNFNSLDLAYLVNTWP